MFGMCFHCWNCQLLLAGQRLTAPTVKPVSHVWNSYSHGKEHFLGCSSGVRHPQSVKGIAED